MQMSSPCLSGGGRAYGLDLEMVKAQSTSTTRSSQTSSPSSTLSESSNSPLAIISTRKPRTPRKRPNQTYNEAAALLSTAYPTIFSTKHLSNGRRSSSSSFTNPHHSLLLDDPSDLLLPFRVFDNSGFLLQQPIRHKPSFASDARGANLAFSDKSYGNRGEVEDLGGNSVELSDGCGEDFDTESILDEEMEEGIDSIMGNLSVSNETRTHGEMDSQMGFQFGGRFQHGNGIGIGIGMRALRSVDEGNWWNFPIVDMLQISPRLNLRGSNLNSKSESNSSNSNSNSKSKSKSTPSEKKKKKKVEKPAAESKNMKLELPKEDPIKESSAQQSSPGLLLKLNYDDVLSAWSDRGSPFSDDVEGNDVSVCLSSLVGK